jgi:hypothetical protein
VKSRANKAENCFLYCPFSGRGHKVISLRLAKLRITFYAQIGYLCFHIASTHIGHSNSSHRKWLHIYSDIDVKVEHVAFAASRLDIRTFLRHPSFRTKAANWYVLLDWPSRQSTIMEKGKMSEERRGDYPIEIITDEARMRAEDPPLIKITTGLTRGITFYVKINQPEGRALLLALHL